MSKPSAFSSTGGIFLMLQVIAVSHSLCAYAMPACHTDTIPLCTGCLCLPLPTTGFGGPGERWLFSFACDTLFPFTSKRFFQCCLLGTRCCSGLELPRLLGLGSWTALIQFTTQLRNCSQSPVDLDVKQRSSCTSPGKEEESLVGL